MTAITHSPQRDASQTPAYRLAALLLGVGTLHFVAPKQFDGIIPVELPGSPRFYTYASGVAEVGIGAALLVRSTRRLAAFAAAALFVGSSRATSTWSGCGGTSLGRCASSLWLGCRCRFRW